MKRNPDNRKPTRRQLLFGVKPLVEALRADHLPQEIIIAEGSRDERLRELIELARAKHVVIKHVPRARLDRELGNKNNQGVMAPVAVTTYADGDDLIEAIGAAAVNGGEPLVLVLDGIEDPRNLGAILRTAECAGVQGVFIPERRAAGLNETVAKASAGAIEHLSISRVTNLSVLIKQLKERNLWVVGAAGDAAIDYSEWDWTRPSAIDRCITGRANDPKV